MASSDYKALGRLSDPTLTLETEPRLDPRLRVILSKWGLDKGFPPPKVTKDSSVADISAWIATGDKFIEGLYATLPQDLPTDADEPAVTESTETVQAADGHTINLYVFRPTAAKGTLPCVVYSHGGGMVHISTANKVHMRWCKSLAATGIVCIATDFRNAWTPEKANYFPIGLNDCAAAVQWTHANKAKLGISSIVLQGESGGGNLAIATTLKANREGWVKCIDGVYASVPYISGGYGWSRERKLCELPSLVECDSYFLSGEGMAVSAHWYGPKAENVEDPLAWPLNAKEADLKGLPPHIISVDELDPLRDEGMVFCRKLLAAGVSAVGKMNLGLIHAGEMIFRQAMPDVYAGAVRDISTFAKSLDTKARL